MISKSPRWLIALAPIISACPYDPSAAGLTQVDGGYVYGDRPDGGVFIPDIDASGPDMLAEPPTMNQLCMLYIGDLNKMTDYPDRTGTWIEDVKGILGPPPRNGEMMEKDTATLTYLWKGAGDDPAGITLSFEHVLVQYQGDNGGPDHGCFEPSFWLNGIQMRDGSFYPCWRWEYGDPGRVPCPGCIDASKLSRSCLAGSPHPQDCYEPGVMCTSPKSMVHVAK
jgi:hypothetical protein